LSTADRKGSAAGDSLREMATSMLIRSPLITSRCNNPQQEKRFRTFLHFFETVEPGGQAAKPPPGQASRLQGALRMREREPAAPRAGA
jgi:hypothetical protein